MGPKGPLPAPIFCELCATGVTTEWLNHRGLNNVVLQLDGTQVVWLYGVACISDSADRSRYSKAIPNLEQQLKQNGYSDKNAANMSTYLLGGPWTILGPY